MNTLRSKNLFLLYFGVLQCKLFLVLDCFGYFRLFSINLFLILSRGLTAGEQTPLVILGTYMTLYTTQFTHSNFTNMRFVCSGTKFT